jgi:hypothetical protein
MGCSNLNLYSLEACNRSGCNLRREQEKVVTDNMPGTSWWVLRSNTLTHTAHTHSHTHSHTHTHTLPHTFRTLTPPPPTRHTSRLTVRGQALRLRICIAAPVLSPSHTFTNSCARFRARGVDPRAWVRLAVIPFRLCTASENVFRLSLTNTASQWGGGLTSPPDRARQELSNDTSMATNDGSRRTTRSKHYPAVESLIQIMKENTGGWAGG